MNLVAQVEKYGARGIAFVLVDEDENILTDWDIIEPIDGPSALYGLITGLQLIQNGLTI